MRNKTPVSVTQTRVLRLLGLQETEYREQASERLRAAGVSGSGIPDGMTWAQVRKMTDRELIEKLKQERRE